MKLTKLLILFLFLSLKGFSQQTPSYTLKYDKTEFCAGLITFCNPSIYNKKGEILKGEALKHIKFIFLNKQGNGKLSINDMGVIDISKSDIGNYNVTAIVDLPSGGINSEPAIISIQSCK